MVTNILRVLKRHTVIKSEIKISLLFNQHYYPTALSKVEIMHPSSKNITQYLNSWLFCNCKKTFLMVNCMFKASLSALFFTTFDETHKNKAIE